MTVLHVAELSGDAVDEQDDRTVAGRAVRDLVAVDRDECCIGHEWISLVGCRGRTLTYGTVG